MKILIVEDEPDLRETIRISLLKEHFVVETAADYFSALDKVNDYDYDCILLDIMLPGGSGLDLLRELKRLHRSDSVLIISAKDSLDDKVEGLELGADDYLTKPFHNGELLARIRSAIRSIREEKDQSAILSFGDLTIDMPNHCVKKKNEIIKLTSIEFSILSLMAQNAGKVLTHQYLLKEVWGVAYQSQPQYLRVFIAQLRKKIENDPSFPTFILTESGIGYRFSEQAER